MERRGEEKMKMHFSEKPSSGRAGRLSGLCESHSITSVHADKRLLLLSSRVDWIKVLRNRTSSTVVASLWTNTADEPEQLLHCLLQRIHTSDHKSLQQTATAEDNMFLCSTEGFHSTTNTESHSPEVNQQPCFPSADLSIISSHLR